MTYEEALQKINSRLRFGIKPGLERIEALCKKLGDPQKKPRFVHVAGTNGKGTTCTLIASVLTAAGYRTGLYTSPYVLDFRERFRIDGEMIPEAELIEEVKRVSPIADELEAKGETITEFEFITALAFDWFAQRDCDFVVLEVGLGGRFDATNVIDTPEAAAIASISLDHTAILGDTYAKIAFEKAGIIKKGGDVVLYPVQDPSVFETVESACNERGAHLHIPDEKNMQVPRSRGAACRLRCRLRAHIRCTTPPRRLPCSTFCAKSTQTSPMRRCKRDLPRRISRRVWRFYPKSRSCF